MKATISIKRDFEVSLSIGGQTLARLTIPALMSPTTGTISDAGVNWGVIGKILAESYGLTKQVPETSIEGFSEALKEAKGPFWDALRQVLKSGSFDVDVDPMGIGWY